MQGYTARLSSATPIALINMQNKVHGPKIQRQVERWQFNIDIWDHADDWALSLYHTVSMHMNPYKITQAIPDYQLKFQMANSLDNII